MTRRFFGGCCLVRGEGTTRLLLLFSTGVSGLSALDGLSEGETVALSTSTATTAAGLTRFGFATGVTGDACSVSSCSRVEMRLSLK